MTEDELENLYPPYTPLLGFVALAYGRGALTAEEVRRWAWRVMELVPDADVVRLHPAVFDLTEFEGTEISDFSRATNISASGTVDERYAMDAISRRRGINTKWTIAGRKAAERALERNPHIEARFRAVFPFIAW